MHLQRLKIVAIALVAIGGSFFISLKIMDWLSPGATVGGPALAKLPPLPPASRTSFVVVPVTIPLSVIRDAAERNVQHDFAGKARNPISKILQDANIGWTASRGPITATGANDVLSLSTPLTGKLNITGSLSSKATGALGSALGGLFGANAAKAIGRIDIKALNADAEIKGNVTVTAQPRLADAWFVEPNLAAQVSLGNSNLSVAGAHINVPTQVKPLIDKAVEDQMNALADRIRRDPTLKRTARAEWIKACRSMPLQGTGSTAAMPPLWLEIKPTRAIAAQPVVDASAVTLTIGIEAQTRITPAPTKPDCPFPDKITIIPPTPGGVSIGVPIDLPFTELNKVIEAQFAGKTFPEDGSGPVEITVRHASVAASGDRLLISLRVHAKTRKSFFGFGTNATIQIWGRPMLDEAQQTLRLTDIELAVQSKAAFGLLGAAARAVMPRLQQVLYENTVIDLKPFAANAKKKIAEAIDKLQDQDSESGMQVDATIDNLRLASIAFDSKTLRVIAQAEGAINVRVSKLR